MRNYNSPGDDLSVIANANVDSGDVFLAGQLVGICEHDALNGAAVTIRTRGVFDVPKASADIFTLGGAVFYDTVNKLAHSHDTTDSNSAGLSTVQIGVCVLAAGAGGTTVRVKLGVPATLV